jgi:hypothetical protein
MMWATAAVVVGVAMACLAGPTYSLDNGVAELAPLGWSSWNALKGSFTEATIRAQADAMVRSGMQAAGYTWVRVAPIHAPFSPLYSRETFLHSA